MPAPGKRASLFAKTLQEHMTYARLRQSDLKPFLGRQSRVSKILTGRIQPSLQDLSRVRYGLGIPFDFLIPAPPKSWLRAVKRRP